MENDLFLARKAVICLWQNGYRNNKNGREIIIIGACQDNNLQDIINDLSEISRILFPFEF